MKNANLSLKSWWFTLLGLLMALYWAGCVGTVAETQKKGMAPIADGEYVVPKKPVDRHAIGWAWSKQFGPVEGFTNILFLTLCPVQAMYACDLHVYGLYTGWPSRLKI